MPAPTPPFLGLSIYKHAFNPTKLAAEVLRNLSVPNAGPILVSLCPPLEEIRCQDNEEAWTRFGDLDSNKMVQFETFLADENLESEAATVGNWNPFSDGTPRLIVETWWNGSAFMAPLGTEATRMRRGGLAYNRLLKICEVLNPTYASITVEEELQAPRELAKNPDSYCFEEFFIGAELGETLLQQVTDLCREAYIERVGNGTYVSMNRWFNPRQVNLDNKAKQKCSKAASHMLAAAVAKRGWAREGGDG
ncbi:MAG TPA: hypothetical protein VG944_16705 [Fimbriimonas sp.]|nr:hypothetical protein [Fimbriimonas sp.]